MKVKRTGKSVERNNLIAKDERYKKYPKRDKE